MKNGLSLCLFGLLVVSCAANAKAGQSLLSATVMRVQKHDADSSFAGSNPTDAPLRSDVYVYDIWLLVDCAIYVGRYESSFDQPPPMFAPERHLDVRIEKHFLYASMPGGGDAKLSILRRGPASAGLCSGH
jgi:hypothetical protein